MQEVVITGVGVVSPLGCERSDFLAACLAGSSGIVTLPELAGSGIAAPFGGKVTNFDPKLLVKPRKSLKVMSFEIQVAFSTASLAWMDAGLESVPVMQDRCGVVCGSEMLYSDPVEQADAYRSCMDEDGVFHEAWWGEKALSQMYPLWMLKYLPNMPGCHISIANDWRGHCNTIVSSEASSLLAIAEGARVIRRGIADVMVVGGVGSRLHPTPLTWRDGASASSRADAPQAASRPFDRDRDGMVHGEGAGMLILESREHAERRNATILGTVRGYASSYGKGPNRYGITQKAIENTIQGALDMSGISAHSLGHVNANGLSTIDDDVIEAQAIAKILGDVPVTAPKSLFGNLGAGAGAVELIASLLALRQNKIPPTRNYENPDTNCPVNVVSETTSTFKKSFLKLNQSRLGFAASILVEAE